MLTQESSPRNDDKESIPLMPYSFKLAQNAFSHFSVFRRLGDCSFESC